MMVVIFFLFMFTGAAKIVFSNYSVNEYYPSTLMVSDSDADPSQYRVGNVLYLGDGEDIQKYAEEWCRYNKRHFTRLEHGSTYEGDFADVSFLIVDGASLQEEDIDFLFQAGKSGCTVCFATIPSLELLHQNTDLAQFMGIHSIQRDETKLTGIHLYSGFLMGGEIVYKASDKRAEKYQDFNLRIPWFVLESASKVYMSGILNDAYEETDATYIPPIIWKYNTGDSSVYTINNDFMGTIAALGIYTALEGTKEEYYVYPIINSQNMVLVNYPTFAEENVEEIRELYSRDTLNFLESLVWPIASQVSFANHLTPSFMISSRLDYGEPCEFKNNYYDEFFEIIRECHGEAGLSAVAYQNASLEEKLSQDMDFLHSFDDYHYYSAYIGDLDNEVAIEALEDTNENIRTCISDYSLEEDLISSKNDVVYLEPTVSSQYYSYRKDFNFKAIETALGYSMSLQDMSNCVYPNSKKDHLQNFSEDYAGCLDTIYKGFHKLKDTTVTECGNRVREYLNLEYTTNQSDNGDVITISTNSVGVDKYFVLRLPNKRIKRITGGEYEKLEDGMYLITFTSSSVDITIEENHSSFFDFLMRD